MQGLDDHQITRTGMLLLIMQLLSLAGVVVRIAAQHRPVDHRLLRAFCRTEYVMLGFVAGILCNVDTRAPFPDIDDFDSPDNPVDREAELMLFAASFQQIAMSLAVLLAMHPRAFRDRSRTSSISGGLSPSSFRGGVAEPGIQRWDGDGFALSLVTPNASSIRQFPISGSRIKSGLTAYQVARAPP